MRLFLFRHGLSNANKARLVTGTPEDSLSFEGIEQAKRLATWIEKVNIKADFYTFSHWQRAQQTAKYIFADVSWHEDRRIGETFAGSVAALPLQQFLQEQPDFYLNPENHYPDGESHLDLQQRVQTWFHELVDSSYRNVVAVTHAGPIACILHDILDIPMSRFPAILPQNATLTVIDAERKGGKIVTKLIGLSLGATENLHDSLKG